MSEKATSSRPSEKDQTSGHDLKVYQPTDREKREQKIRLRKEQLLSHITTMMLGQSKIAHFQNLYHDLNLSRMKRQDRRPEALSSQAIMKEITKRPKIESSNIEQFHPLPAVLEITDPTRGLNYSTMRRFEGTALNQFLYLDSTEIDGEPNCARIMIPKERFGPEDCYVLQIPSLKARDESAATQILSVLKKNLITDERRLELEKYEQLLIEKPNFLFNWLYHLINGLEFNDCHQPEEVVQVVQDRSLWAPKFGEIIVTQVGADGVVIQNKSHDWPRVLADTGKVQGYLLEGYSLVDKTVKKENFITISEPVLHDSSYHNIWRVGQNFNLQFLMLILSHAQLHQLRLGSSGKSKEKRIEQPQSRLVTQSAMG